jgi:hypothetical protein
MLDFWESRRKYKGRFWSDEQTAKPVMCGEWVHKLQLAAVLEERLILYIYKATVVAI